MRESQAQRRRASDDFAVFVVLRTVARAHELILSLVPRDNAAEMSANSIDSEVFNATLSGDQVCCISLKALHELVVARFVRSRPCRQFDVITDPVLSSETAASTASASRVKV